ncbi:membrane protein [Mycolicibacterium phocaicum]|nr:membrane protein [Mycolicibacterium phocaicum]
MQTSGAAAGSGVSWEARMPLSDHEQRMLDQIESALYAEDPKFASSVRGGTLHAPSARRRLQGAGLFVLGLALLVLGVAFRILWINQLPILSVIGFVVMFAGAVFAVTGPRVLSKEKSTPSSGKSKRARAGNSFTNRMEDRFRRRFDE